MGGKAGFGQSTRDSSRMAFGKGGITKYGSKINKGWLEGEGVSVIEEGPGEADVGGVRVLII